MSSVDIAPGDRFVKASDSRKTVWKVCRVVPHSDVLHALMAKEEDHKQLMTISLHAINDRRLFRRVT